jgi:5'-nucleotidase (lipoprotein e(P4) family)
MNDLSVIPGGWPVGRISRWLTVGTVAGLLLAAGSGGRAQQQAAARELAIKYTRDSAEYAALARQVYRIATDTVLRSIPAAAGQRWAVILDVDETALDNSTYQLERAAYDVPFDASTWSAWIRRRQAAPVPGAVDFVAAVRNAGGHVAWITNRTAAEAEDTRANLRQVQLWSDDDRLCAQDDRLRTKRARRAEVLAGTGNCAWTGEPMRVLALVGDQMSDFPDADEPLPGAGSDAAFGRTSFLLPNPMYGAWTTRVTRTDR